MANPLCEKCLEEGKITPAIDVHHIDSFMNYTGIERLKYAFSFENLLSICKSCHASLHHHG